MSNDRIIHAPLSKIEEAIMPTINNILHNAYVDGIITNNTIRAALASLGGDGNTTLKSAFSILQKHHDFIQKNGEKPSEYVEDCILRAMEEYASQFSHPSERELLSNFAKQWNKTSLFAKITTADIDRYLAEKHKTEKK